VSAVASAGGAKPRPYTMSYKLGVGVGAIMVRREPTAEGGNDW
jgi:hypothetical protein